MTWPWNQPWSEGQLPAPVFILAVVVWLLAGIVLIWGGWPLEWKLRW